MAWNEPGNKGNKDPWGNKGGNDKGPPDLDEVFRNLSKRFGGKGGGSATGQPFNSSLLITATFLVVANCKPKLSPAAPEPMISTSYWKSCCIG